MLREESKQVVARFVELSQNQHDLLFADEIFHPQIINHFAPAGRLIVAVSGRPAAGFQTFHGCSREGFPDAVMEINE